MEARTNRAYNRAIGSVTLLAITMGVTALAAAEPDPKPPATEPKVLSTSEAISAAPTPDLPFTDGKWTFETYASTTFLDDDHGDLSTLHAGVGYYLTDRVSLNALAFAGWAESNVDDAGIVGGLDLLARWHFLMREKWSLYLDGGVGFQQADTDFPSDTHHNFRPQAGVGIAWHVNPRVRLIGGARYLHVSNASTSPGNDGGDWAQPYVGVMASF